MNEGRAGDGPVRTAVSGPLASYVEGWRGELAARGYAPHSITAHLQLVAHLSWWLHTAGKDLDSLTDEVLGEYLCARRQAGYRNRITMRAVAPLLGYLRDLQVVPDCAACPAATPLEETVEEFGDYLVNERGLTPGRCITTEDLPGSSWLAWRSPIRQSRSG